MSEPNMVKVGGDGVEIQVAEWGGKGKNVLCIHGITAAGVGTSSHRP